MQLVSQPYFRVLVRAFSVQPLSETRNDAPNQADRAPLGRAAPPLRGHPGLPPPSRWAARDGTPLHACGSSARRSLRPHPRLACGGLGCLPGDDIRARGAPPDGGSLTLTAGARPHSFGLRPRADSLRPRSARIRVRLPPSGEERLTLGAGCAPVRLGPHRLPGLRPHPRFARVAPRGCAPHGGAVGSPRDCVPRRRRWGGVRLTRA